MSLLIRTRPWGSLVPHVLPISLLLSLCVAANVRADGERYKGVTALREQEAQVRYQEGVTALKEGRCDDAVWKFEQSYQTAEHWETLFNLGRAHACAGHPVEAVDAWETYYRSSDDETRRRFVVQEIVKQKAKIGTLVLRVNQERAEVSIDGRPSGRTPLPELRLAQGEHSVQVALDGYQPQQRNVYIVGGEQKELTLALASIAPAPVSGPGRATDGDDPGDKRVQVAPDAGGPELVSSTHASAVTGTSKPERGSNLQHTIGVSLMVAGAVGLVPGGVLLGLGRVNHGTAVDRRLRGNEDGALRLNDDATLLTNIGIGTLIGSGALILAGFIVKETAPSPRKEARAGLQLSGWASASVQGIQVLHRW